MTRGSVRIDGNACVSFLVGQTSSYVSIMCDEPDDSANRLHACHFTFPIRIGTNFGMPSRDQRSCISSLDPATSWRNCVQSWEIRIEQICGTNESKESVGEQGKSGEDRTISRGSRDGIRPAHAQTQYIHQVFKLVSVLDRQRVGGWVGGWWTKVASLTKKKVGFKRRGSEGRRDKWGREGGKDGKVKQRDVFFKNKDLAVSMSLIDFIQY